MNKKSFLEQLKEYENSGIRLVEWLSARDELVCPLCRKREGELFTVEEFKKELENKLCQHKSCRCTLVAFVDIGQESTEEIWKKYPAMIAVLKSGILSEEEINQAKVGAYRILDNDIVWGALNKKVLNKMQTGAWLEMSKIYLEMALLLDKEGKNYYDILEQSKKCDLMFYKKQDITEFRLNTKFCCEKCAVLDGKRLNFDEALKVMPTLIRNCTRDKLQNRKGFCSCSVAWFTAETTSTGEKDNYHVVTKLTAIAQPIKRNLRGRF